MWLCRPTSGPCGAGLDDVTVAPVAEPGTFEPRGIVSNVNITFYDCADQGFCGAMYNGRKVYEGRRRL